MERNERIFHFLNPEGCWHEVVNAFGDVMSCEVPTCKHCKAINLDPFAEWNPDYSTEAGFFLLLAGLEAKGCSWKMALYAGYSCHIWTVDQRPTADEPAGTAIGTKLTEVAAEATLKLIDKTTNPELSDHSTTGQSKQESHE